MRSQAAGRAALRAAGWGLVTLAALEVGAALLLWLSPGFESRDEIQATLLPTSAAEAAQASSATPGAVEEDRAGRNVLHPYLGFVRSWDATLYNEVNQRVVDLPVNELGFFGPAPPVGRRRRTLTVALTGGSVATELYFYGRDALRDALETAQAEALRGRDIEIVSLALAGMKQPQQLMALNYLLALGHHVDVLVNLDGFNEVALPVLDVERFDTFWAYPTRWRFQTAASLDLAAVRLVGQIDAVRSTRERHRQRFSSGLLRISSVALALWHGLERRSRAEESALEAELTTRLGETRGDLQASGPPNRFGSRRELYQHAVELWKRSSRQMAQLAAANDIAYYHFLQPSQYVEGSKTLTARERERAFSGDTGFGRVGVTGGYPLLRHAGRELANDGVRFADLTGLFSADTGEIYRDLCCHLTDRGYKILGARIGRDLAPTH